MACAHDHSRVRLSKSVLPPLPGGPGFFVIGPDPKQTPTLKEALGVLGGHTVTRQGWVIVVQRDGEIINLERQPADMSFVQAEARAEALVEPDSLVLLGEAVEGNRNGTIYKTASTLDYPTLISRLNAGIADIDLMMAATGRTSVQKVTDEDVFPQDIHTEALTATLAELASKTIGVTIEDLVELAAITDWTQLGKDGIGPVISQMSEKLLLSGEAFASRITNPLLAEGMRIVKAARQWDAAKYGWGEGGKNIPANGPISASFDLVDRQSVDFLRKSTVNFVTDQFKQRSELLSEAARRIAARGFEQGLGSDEIAKDMAQWLQLRGGNPHYYRVVSMSYTVRAESYGHLSTYQQAGVEAAIFVSVIDERTSNVCRWADGKTIRVGKALDMYKRLEKLKDPQDVKYENPWVRDRSLGEGKRELYIRHKDGSETSLAEISRSGMGVSDDRGDYTDKIKEMQDVGIGPPPLHGLCRSTTQAVIL